MSDKITRQQVENAFAVLRKPELTEDDRFEVRCVLAGLMPARKIPQLTYGGVTTIWWKRIAAASVVLTVRLASACSDGYWGIPPSHLFAWFMFTSVMLAVALTWKFEE